jgi:hypothetical protein
MQCRRIVIKCPQNPPKNGSKFLKGPQKQEPPEGKSPFGEVPERELQRLIDMD